MSLLLCDFSSSRISSYHLSHMAFVFSSASKRFFWLVLTDRRAGSEFASNVGHQLPLDRLAGLSDLALVVDDGPAQLTRISLSRAICQGLDQEVSTSLRWDLVVDGLGLLLQRLEILWHKRSRGGGCCTRGKILTSPEPRVSFLLGILGVWHSGRTGISAPMLSRGNMVRSWREHGNCVSSQVIAKEREYVAVMSVGSPGVVLWHVVCPKLCCALPKASHLTHSWPGIINRHFALLSQESDCRSSAFSEDLTEKLFIVHRVEWCSSRDTHHAFLFSQ